MDIKQRREEIFGFLVHETKYVGNYVVLDDFPLSELDQEIACHHVKTDATIGLSEENVLLAERLLLEGLKSNNPQMQHSTLSALQESLNLSFFVLLIFSLIDSKN